MMTNAEINKLFEAKVRRGIFHPIERHLRVDLCEERMAEALAFTFEFFANKAKQGCIVDDALLVHHARLRALDCSRCFVRGYCRRACDVLDHRPFAAGKVQVFRLDGIATEDDDLGGEGDPELLGLASELSANPAGKIVSAINLERWLEQLDDADREMVELRGAGHGLAEIAESLGTHITRACHRLHQLGEELADHAALATGKKARKPRSSTKAARVTA